MSRQRLLLFLTPDVEMVLTHSAVFILGFSLHRAINGSFREGFKRGEEFGYKNGRLDTRHDTPGRLAPR